MPAHGALYLDDAAVAYVRERIAAKADPWTAELGLLAGRLKALRDKNELGASLEPAKDAGGPRLFRSLSLLSPRDRQRPGGLVGDVAVLLRDAHLARDLALHWRLAGGPAEADARAAATILLAWTARIQPAVPDDRVALDMAVGLPAMLYAADLLWDSPAFDAAARRPFLDWVLELAKGVRRQYEFHVGYRTKAAGLYQATWSRHLALAVGVLLGDADLAGWAMVGDDKPWDGFPRILQGGFDDQGRPLRLVGLEASLFAIEPLMLMSLIRGAPVSDTFSRFGEKVSDTPSPDTPTLAALGLADKGRAWTVLNRAGRFLCGDIDWPGAGRELPVDRKGRPMLPIVFGEATLFVPLTQTAPDLAARVLRHNPRVRHVGRDADDALDDRARIEPWVLGPVWLTHYRPPPPPTRPASEPAK